MSESWKARVALTKGDITESDAEAIVNAANNDLLLGGGVAGAIRKKGGPQIQEECRKIGPIALGEAALTTGGELKARYVIHAASMRLGGPTTEENLRASTRNSLKRAAEKHIRSMAFPAIGTGVAGFPMDRCAQVMLEEIRDHLQRSSTPEKVRFVLFDKQALEAFAQALAKMTE